MLVRLPRLILCTLLLLAVGAGCDANRISDLPSASSQPTINDRPALVIVAPDSATLAVGDVMQMQAKVYDQAGNELVARDIRWRLSSSRTSISRDGILEGMVEGVDTITASLDGRTGSAVLRIRPPRVSSLIVSLSSNSITVGGSATALAVAKAADGQIVESRVYWKSSNTSVAVIDYHGHIRGRNAGSTNIIGVSEGRVDSKPLTVVANQTTPFASSITITSPTSVLYVGKTAKLTATVKDADGNAMPGVAVTWSSSNPAFATITNDGTVTGRGPGAVTFTAANGQLSSETALTIAPLPVAALTLTLQPTSVTVGTASLARAELFDVDGELLSGRVVVYSSSNTGVATVAANGNVTTHSAGATLITAGSEGKTDSEALTVTAATPIPVATVAVTLAHSARQVGQNTQATALVRDAGGNVLSGRPIVWSSSATAVATVNSSGVVTTVAAGTASITASSEGKTGSANLGVSAAPIVVSTVDVSVLPSLINVGETAQAVATPKDSAGTPLTGLAVSWSSSNSAVASVAANGRVTAVAQGSASISASVTPPAAGISEQEAGLVAPATGVASITVNAPAPPPPTQVAVATVSLSLAPATVLPGQTSQGTVVLRDAQGNSLTGRAISYSSSNTTIASVSSTGQVTAKILGNATITATSEGKSGTASLDIVSSIGGGGGGSPGSAMPNRPGSLSQILDWDASSQGSVGFGMTDAGYPKVMSDGSGPRSPGQLVRFLNSPKPEGEQSPSGFVMVDALNLKEVYVARWLRPSANYVADGAGSKSMMMHFGGPNGGSFYWNYEITSAGALINPINLQPNNSTYDTKNDTWVGRNRASTPIPRGQWGLWEFYLKLNDPGQSNGIVRAWANGVLQLEFTNWRFIPAGENWSIDHVVSNFYQNGAQSFDMWWDMDHFYVSGSSTSAPAPAPAPAAVSSVSVALTPSSIDVGQTSQATAIPRDAGGAALTGRSVSWSSSNNSVATVNSSGQVTGVSAGTANIIATSEGRTGSASVTVSASTPTPPPPQPAAVATVSVSLSILSVLPGQSSQASVVLRDAQGNVLTGRSVSYSSSSPLTATVSSSGQVTALLLGSATISATSEGKSGSATLDIISSVGGGGGAVGSAMPNRPSAVPTILDWDAASVISGFAYTEAGYPKIIADGSGPKSPGQVVRFLNSPKPPDQQSPSGYVMVDGLNLKEVYVARWIRPSANYVADGGGSKSMMMHFGGPNGGAFYWNYEQKPEGMLINPINLQPNNSTFDTKNDTWVGRNRASTPIPRGQWGLWEFYVKLNDPGQNNGIVRAWANGVLQLEFTNWRFIPAGENWGIDHVVSNFYQNGAQPFEMWWDMDHFFVGGR